MPNMSSNFWIGCLQLLHWVFLQPFTLRRYTAYLVPGLSEDFTLWEARNHILTANKLRRFLLQSLALMVIFSSVIVLIFLFIAVFLGWPVNWTAAMGGLIACILVGLSLGTGVSVAAGIGTGIGAGIGNSFFGGILLALVLGLGNIVQEDVIAGLQMGVLLGISGGTGLVIAFILLGKKAGESTIIVAGSVIGGSVAGMGFGLSGRVGLIFAVVIGIGLGIFVISIAERNLSLKVTIPVTIGIAAGIYAGVASGIYLGLNNVIEGGVIISPHVLIPAGIFIGVATTMALGVPKRAEKDAAASFIIAFTLTIGTCIALALVGGIHSLEIGIISALEGGVPYISAFILFTFHLTYYPFELVWQILMIYQANRNPKEALRYLRLSPVYWDDHIWLPLPFLDNLLLLATRSNQDEALSEIAFVAQSFRQQWAASNALAAFTAEKLASYKMVDQIIKIEDEVFWLPDDLTTLGKDIAEVMPRFLSISRDVDVAVKSDSIYNRRLGLREALERLENLEKSLNFQGSHVHERWYPVIESWQKILLAKLDASNTLSQDETINIVNPYVVGNPLRLNRKGLFKGRLELRDNVAKALLERGRQTLVLHGPRRMGKTSFLLQLPALLSGKSIPVFLDLQRPAYLMDDASFLFSVARSITRDARPYRLIIPSPNREDFQAAPFFAFDDWLDEQALPAMADFHLLIMFDEFEKLGEAVTNEQISRKLLDEMRHTIQHREEISLLFAGVQTLEQLGPDWSSYFINVQPLRISYLNPIEAKDLICNPDPDISFNLSYTDDAVSKILEETRCHPYLLQLVCFAIVELSNKHKILEINSDDVEKAITTALKQGRPYFQNIWDEATGGSMGQKWLKQAAQVGEVIPSDVESQEDQRAITKLVQNSILTQVDEKYMVEVPLIKRWVLEDASII